MNRLRLFERPAPELYSPSLTRDNNWTSGKEKSPRRRLLSKRANFHLATFAQSQLTAAAVDDDDDSGFQSRPNVSLTRHLNEDRQVEGVPAVRWSLDEHEWDRL